MLWVTDKLIAFMIKNSVISDDDDTVAFYRYGIEISISSLLNILLVLIIGMIVGRLINALVFLCTFVFVRRFTGGYHADTYFRCNLIMCMGFIVVNLSSVLFMNSLSVFHAVTIETVVIVIIVLFGPIENPNKPIGIKDKKKYKALSIIIVTGLSVLSLILIGFHYIHGAVLVFTMLLISILMIAARIKERS